MPPSAETTTTIIKFNTGRTFVRPAHGNYRHCLGWSSTRCEAACTLNQREHTAGARLDGCQSQRPPSFDYRWTDVTRFRSRQVMISARAQVRPTASHHHHHPSRCTGLRAVCPYHATPGEAYLLFSRLRWSARSWRHTSYRVIASVRLLVANWRSSEAVWDHCQLKLPSRWSTCNFKAVDHRTSWQFFRWLITAKLTMCQTIWGLVTLTELAPFSTFYLALYKKNNALGLY